MAKFCKPVFLAILTLNSLSSFAAVFVTGSANQSSSNLGLQSTRSTGGSVSFDLALGTYIRVGLTHQLSVRQSSGYFELDEDSSSSNSTVGANGSRYVSFKNNERISANSVDLTFILYNGLVLVPYVKSGALWKSYSATIERQDEDPQTINVLNAGPSLYAGLGVGIKLNHKFTLKLFYKASPGITYDPQTDETKSQRDEETTVGLTYQL